jgi:hypothetical protein
VVEVSVTVFVAVATAVLSTVIVVVEEVTRSVSDIHQSTRLSGGARDNRGSKWTIFHAVSKISTGIIGTFRNTFVPSVIISPTKIVASVISPRSMPVCAVHR